MLGEIIWKLIKTNENEKITSKYLITWAKRVKLQRAQSTIMNSLTEAKEFDKLEVVKKHAEVQS